jgi:aspartate 1-decarboxylase
MDKKIMKLKNLYSGDIVFTEDINDIRKVNEMEFIEVFNEENSQRKYLVNRNAFVPVTK